MPRAFPLLAAFVYLAACAAPRPVPAPPTNTSVDEPAPRGRLPEDVRPLRYALALELVPDREEYRGSVTITIHLDRARTRLWLHGQRLAVERATVTTGGGAAFPAAWREHESGVASLTLPRPIGPGEATLRIDYRAAFGRQLHGIFRLLAGGQYYAFTQLESTYARQAFPCFDEPRFKTPFDSTIDIQADHEVIANTPIAATEVLAGGMKRVRFAESPPLPTYLVAFAVGPLDVVSAPAIAPSRVRERPIPLRGIAPRGHGKELAYLLARAPPVFAVLEDYFGIAYPYQKLDLIAVPDFQDGAMENAAAITGRDVFFLVDEATAPVAVKRLTVATLAHELAHQWFGDLVTMGWWDDVWLNESFATWMESRALQSVAPENESDVELVGAMQHAMDEDSLVSARRVRQPVESNQEIENVFDAITYAKGGGVLAMFERWIGADAFRRGIHDYLAAHRFGTATTDDFLAALSAASGRDVSTPLRDFLDQPGVPLVEVRLDCTARPGGGVSPSLRLSQSRFLPVGSTGARDLRWRLPVCARYAAGEHGATRESCTLLAASEGQLPLDGDTCPAWVMPNAEGVGYYRWSLDADGLRRLRERGYPHLSVAERLSFADSLEAAFDAAKLPAAEVLAALEPLARDPHHRVASRPMHMLSFAHDYLADPALRGAVQRRGRHLYRPLYDQLGWTPHAAEKHADDDELLRHAVIQFLAREARDPDVRREAARRGRAFLGVGGDGKLHPEAVSPDLAMIAVAVAAQEGDLQLVDVALTHLAATEDPLLRQRLLTGMAAAEAPAAAARVRELVLDARLRTNERILPLEAQMAEPATREAAWTWLAAHLDRLARLLPEDETAELPSLGACFCDAAHARDVERLFGPRVTQLAGSERALAKTLEGIALCAASVAAHRKSARTYFDSPPPD